MGLSNISDENKLRERMENDGYLFFRGILNRKDILSAREEIFTEMLKVGEIAEPPINGIATGNSNRRKLVPDLIEFWKDISENIALS